MCWSLFLNYENRRITEKLSKVKSLFGKCKEDNVRW